MEAIFIIFIVVYIWAILMGIASQVNKRKKMNLVFYNMIRTQKKITAADFASACANYQFSLFAKGIVIEGKEAQKFLKQKAKELGGIEISERGAIIYDFESAKT
ncbi:hypothetical protein [Aerosakkonema funiforme]|uniref:hypothetical protein n=1 Tax=Aerosakkonema funiforme TaxID=1246630 RepID=UPI0035B93A6F